MDELQTRMRELAEKTYLQYVVIFKSEEPQEEVRPWLPYKYRLNDRRNTQKEPLFDPELVPIFKALWYCMHLPRVSLDLLDQHEYAVSHQEDVPHIIIPIPSYIADSNRMLERLQMYNPTLIIYDDCCEQESELIEKAIEPLFGRIAMSELSDRTLIGHGDQISGMAESIGGDLLERPFSPRLFFDEKRVMLPAYFLATQLGLTNNIYDVLSNNAWGSKAAAVCMYKLHLRLKTFVSLSEQGFSVDALSEDIFNKEYEVQQNRLSVPVVLTLPGVPPRHSYTVPLDQQEHADEAVKLIGYHRAISKNGVMIESERAAEKIYIELDNLERHCKSDRQKNQFIWKTLKNIGDILAEDLGSTNMDIIKRASHITCYSDFPIGIAIFPGAHEPLSFLRRISHIPLSPLTRTLQQEFLSMPNLYVGFDLRILVLECLEQNDPIYEFSISGWKRVQADLAEDARVKIDIMEVGTIAELKRQIKVNEDVHILVISAHGSYSEEHNIAGLVIGKDIWLADEDDIHVPPVVILSACSTMPRGGGAVTVGDLLRRAGAIAVLGALIPVDVGRNTILMARFFHQILETMNGATNNQTLLDIWINVAKTNAINDIIASSPFLQRWIMEQSFGGITPVEEFMLKRCAGRLRHGHVYDDTLEVLGEMLTEKGHSEQFRTIVSEGFFPETAFYTFVGYPEKIMIYNKDIQTAFATSDHGRY